jgi:nucleoredoxin
MRRRFFVTLVFVSLSTLMAVAGQLPLTVKDISLMLRSGYSSNAILKELAVRHFADTLDEPKQNTLLQAHASDDLIKALQSGAYSLSAEKTAAVQQQIADQAKRRNAEAERLQFNTLDHDRRVQESQAGVFNAPGVGHHVIYDFVKDDLVSSQNGSVTHFDDAKLESKKYIALYFSAHWCGPCRKFTPELVDYYNRVAPQHPEFEVIFVSDDRSQSDMEKYMHEANMPWPAIDFQKMAGKETIRKYAGRGIPCLVLIDSTGKVVSNSYDGTNYVGPKKVLSDLDGVFAGKPSPQVASAH